MAAEERVIELIIDASGVEAGMRRAESAYDHMSDRAEAATAKAQAAFDRQIQVYTGRLPKSIDGVGDAYDRLQARMDPIFHAQLRAEREMTQSLAVINRAVLLGVTTEEQATRDIIRLKQQQVEAIKRVRDAQMTPVPSDMRPPPAVNDNNLNYRRQNAMYQYFDIGQGLAGGMPLGMIAAQQGPQVAQLYAGQGGLKAAASDVATLASGALAAIGPVGIAFGVAGTAALAYYALTKRESKTTEELLKTHQESISRVATLWGDAAEQRSKYGRVSTDAVTLGLDNSISAMTKRLQENVSSGDVGAGISSAINLNKEATGLNAGELRQTTIFKTLQLDFDALHKATLTGRPDILGLIGRLQDIRRGSDNAGIRKMADDAVEALKPFRDLAEALREADMQRRRLFEDRGDNGRLLSRGTTNTSDMSAYAGFVESQKISALRSQREFDAQLASLNARSPQQKADAARQSASAQYSNDETAPERRMRIEQAGTMALAQAEKSLTEAREARARNLGKMLTDQQLEILLLGKTAGETATLRREYELVNQLKEEARQNGGIVDEGEVARIHQSAIEVGKLTDQLARMRLQQDAAFEAEQLFRSEREANIAAQLRSANLPVDLSGTDAANLRSLEILKENKQAWEDIRDVGRDAVDELSSGALNGFQDIETIFKGVANDILGEFNKLALANPLKNALYGDTLPTMDSVGGAGGIFKTLLGGNNPAIEAAKQAVGSMSVTAASVVVNGGVGTAGAGSLLGANDNVTGKAPVGDVLRMALPDAGLTKTGIPLSEITAGNGLTAKVNSEYAGRFQGLLNDLKGAGYNVSSLGEGGYSYRNVAGTNNLSKHSFGEALDINPRQNPWSNKFQTDLPANVNDMAKRNGLTWGGTWNKPDTMHFQVDKSADTAALALNKMATNAGAATQNLGTFGNGLGTFGDALSQFPAAPQGGGGGGFGSWLSGLFGGAFVPNGAQATFAANGGLGLYANGGISNRPAIFGEAGPEAAVPLPDGRRIPVEMRMPRIAANNGGARPIVNRSIHFHGAPAGYTAQVEEEEDDQGNEKVNVTFSKMAANEAGRQGSPLNKKLKSMGAKTGMVRR